ncbi:MAG: hypothetical protein SVV03_04875 [Candidatus Nanohaloarchaea archaeon]|nr:hypothetical protein [Candidatus Nanohaloarchaea archaeon]
MDIDSSVSEGSYSNGDGLGEFGSYSERGGLTGFGTRILNYALALPLVMGGLFGGEYRSETVQELLSKSETGQVSETTSGSKSDPGNESLSKDFSKPPSVEDLKDVLESSPEDRDIQVPKPEYGLPEESDGGRESGSNSEVHGNHSNVHNALKLWGAGKELQKIYSRDNDPEEEDGDELVVALMHGCSHLEYSGDKLSSDLEGTKGIAFFARGEEKDIVKAYKCMVGYSSLSGEKELRDKGSLYKREVDGRIQYLLSKGTPYDQNREQTLLAPTEDGDYTVRHYNRGVPVGDGKSSEERLYKSEFEELEDIRDLVELIMFLED